MFRRNIRLAGNASGMSEALWESLFIRACRGAANPHPPVWLMRQAGRYMAEYQVVRREHDFLACCRQPELAARITLEARDRIGADAAIIFSDILLPLETLGLGLRFDTGHGPRLEPPIRSAADISALGDPEQAAGALVHVGEAIAQTRAGLPDDIPLIGFAGSPFTLAAYAIEGGGSRQFAATRSLMYNDPASWHRLQELLVACLVPYLHMQVERGAQALQLFDSWVGQLAEDDYREFVLPYVQCIVRALPEGIPVICFGHGTSQLLPAMAESGCDVLGIDQHTDLIAAWDALGGGEQIAVQGNLDPALLLAPEDRLLAAVDAQLAAAAGRPGYICNLGHGVLKETDVERVVAMVERVHGWSVR